MISQNGTHYIKSLRIMTLYLSSKCANVLLNAISVIIGFDVFFQKLLCIVFFTI